jgi:hypothetical protein
MINLRTRERERERERERMQYPYIKETHTLINFALEYGNFLEIMKDWLSELPPNSLPSTLITKLNTREPTQQIQNVRDPSSLNPEIYFGEITKMFDNLTLLSPHNNLTSKSPFNISNGSTTITIQSHEMVRDERNETTINSLQNSTEKKRKRKKAKHKGDKSNTNQSIMESITDMNTHINDEENESKMKKKKRKTAFLSEGDKFSSSMNQVEERDHKKQKPTAATLTNTINSTIPYANNTVTLSKPQRNTEDLDYVREY